MAQHKRSQVILVLGLGFVTLLFFLWKFGEIDQFRPHYKVTAIFKNIGDIKRGAKVTIGGWKVGVVDAISFPEDGRRDEIQVRIRIFDAYPLPEGTSARVTSKGVVGDEFLALERGQSQEQMLQDGSAKLEGIGPVNMNEVVESIAEISTDVKEAIKHVNGVLAQFETEEFQENLRSASHEAARSMERLSTSLSSLSQVADKLDRGEGTAGLLLNDPRLYDDLAVTLRQVRRLSQRLNQDPSLLLTGGDGEHLHNPNVEALSIDDVIQLSQSGLGARPLMAQIEATQSRFALGVDDILRLKEAGVPEAVIEAMIVSVTG